MEVDINNVRNHLMTLIDNKINCDYFKYFEPEDVNIFLTAVYRRGFSFLILLSKTMLSSLEKDLQYWNRMDPNDEHTKETIEDLENQIAITKKNICHYEHASKNCFVVCSLDIDETMVEPCEVYLSNGNRMDGVTDEDMDKLQFFFNQSPI